MKRVESSKTFQTVCMYFYPKFKDQKSFINRRFISIQTANTKTLQVYKNMVVDGST